MTLIPALEPREAADGWSPRASGYLNACTMGLPSRATVDTMNVAVADWFDGRASASAYGDVVERVRALYARIVSAPFDDVSIGATVSDFAGTVAASVPDGSEVLCIDGDFSSIVFPFVQQAHRGVTVRHVALDRLADEITDDTHLVSFSLIQSADGTLAPVDEIRAAARRHGALLFCDTTQAVGAYPVDASLFDATVCHAYKWLCAPRGVAFLTMTPAFASRILPTNAGWYAGHDVWASCYGPEMTLADTARRFDTSPAWLSWAGAEPALAHFAAADMGAVWKRDVALADALADALGEPRRGTAILTLADPHGERAARLEEAGLRVSSRAGRVRLAFHVWNTEQDVDRAALALIGPGARRA